MDKKVIIASPGDHEGYFNLKKDIGKQQILHAAAKIRREVGDERVTIITGKSPYLKESVVIFKSFRVEVKNSEPLKLFVRDTLAYDGFSHRKYPSLEGIAAIASYVVSFIERIPQVIFLLLPAKSIVSQLTSEMIDGLSCRDEELSCKEKKIERGKQMGLFDELAPYKDDTIVKATSIEVPERNILKIMEQGGMITVLNLIGGVGGERTFSIK